ncbi:MAG: UvrD-helicase domain-containing protein [Gammaproteobacteria bacterium]
MSVAQSPPDQLQRDRALDPRHSFIVQAPAGSGKTELLIQRYLRLLALVDEPEEVLAITFTHKAAGEMRSRVIKALEQAQAGEVPQAAHLRRAYELARDILTDGRREQWQLHRHPARLGISTIDAVNAWIAGRRPAGGGGSARQPIAPDPGRLYQEAARATLGLMADDDEAGRQVAALMRHLDNDAGRFERLLVAMLPRRDQWLRHALDTDAVREDFEAPLRRLAGIGMQNAANRLPPDVAGELLALLPAAAGFLRDTKKAMQLPAWIGRTHFPGTDADDLAAWRDLATALLTDKEGWRRKIDAQNGFPAAEPQSNARMKALIEGLPGCEPLRLALVNVRALPGAAYEDGQWEMLGCLRAVLRLAAAQLRLVCAVRGETDFADVAAAALDALGGSDEPTDLALLLDHRLRHLLVDEFQDTSLAQYTLLERLTAGWSPDDGRSLFLVGDPMQSIYGFREADVGIFMQVRDGGIGQIRPQFLQLTANFRSASPLVEWSNEVFSRTFPAADDGLLGAVQFARSMPVPDDQPRAGVAWHWLPAGDDRAEPRRVLDLLAQARGEDPGQRVCILVRNRSHASAIIAALRSAGIDFVAPEIELLERSGVAQDLLALTRALCQRADRLAWIGVLRAPWCGLSLADLDGLLADDHRSAVTDLLRDAGRVAKLSATGAAAVRRLCAVLDQVEIARERRSLRDLVEGAWLMLGGPATIPEASQLESARTFLDLLDAAGAPADGLDMAWLTAQMAAHKGSLGSGGTGTALQVMTMHKAKGLEFDTVIVAGLGKRTRTDELPLLLWRNVTMPDGSQAPLLAPLPATGADRDPVYGYLRQLDQRRAEAETDRLLYVACTRARRRLHLLAQLEVLADGSPHSIRQPDSRSLLHRLWPAVKAEATAAVAVAAGDWPAVAREREPVWVQPTIRRLPAGWQVPAPPPPLALSPSAPEAAAAAPVAYEWAGRLAMHVGSVVHSCLQTIAMTGVAAWTRERLQAQQPAIRRMLLTLGVPRHELEDAAVRVGEALARTLRDERGRWLLDDSHAEAASELALTVCEGGRFRNLVIDRSFRTDDGTRWVVDFKTSQHEGGDLEAFLRTQSERYREQLRGYRAAMAALGGEPVRTALYFPLLGVFQEVDCGTDGPG